MLFHINAFKSLAEQGPILDSPEKLYNLWILEGLNQQELKLKDVILDQFVFCQVIQEAHRACIALDQQLLSVAI